MRIAVAMIVKIVHALRRRRPPTPEIAERAFERAAAQFHAP